MVKRENGKPEEQYALIIMDTFRVQDNDRFRKLCSENYCEVAIVSHNLTNIFQPLDISVDKVAKAFTQKMYSDWFLNEVATQLNRGVDLTEVKITSKLSDLKPLLASWIVDLYEHLKTETGMTIKGFDFAGITETVHNAQSVYEKIENPFRSP